MSEDRHEYTREQLIKLCHLGIVQKENWLDRDTSDAHRQLGEAWALLAAGCDFEILRQGDLATDDKTIWIEIHFDSFMTFEAGETGNREYQSAETYYLPTPLRIAEAKGKDWY